MCNLLEATRGSIASIKTLQCSKVNERTQRLASPGVDGIFRNDQVDFPPSTPLPMIEEGNFISLQ